MGWNYWAQNIKQLYLITMLGEIEKQKLERENSKK